MPDIPDWRPIARFLHESLPEAPAQPIDTETPLLTSELVDSLTLIELLTFIQEEYAVTIPAARLTLDDLDSLSRITRLVASLRA